jgi:hypothetical protein
METQWDYELRLVAGWPQHSGGNLTNLASGITFGWEEAHLLCPSLVQMTSDDSMQGTNSKMLEESQSKIGRFSVKFHWRGWKVK